MAYPSGLNPFLDDDDYSSISSYDTAELPLPSYPPPPPPMMSNFKLPGFWADAPVAWFAAVEAQFSLRRVTSEEERFCHAGLGIRSLRSFPFFLKERSVLSILFRFL